LPWRSIACFIRRTLTMSIPIWNGMPIFTN